MTPLAIYGHATRYLALLLVLAPVTTRAALAQPPAREAAQSETSPTTAVRATDFLKSIGVVSTFPDRGQPLPKTIEMIKYAGFRWVRGGIEGLTSQGPTTVQTYLELHRQSGAQFSCKIRPSARPPPALSATPIRSS
jgi:hypothetical protein